MDKQFQAVILTLLVLGVLAYFLSGCVQQQTIVGSDVDACVDGEPPALIIVGECKNEDNE